MSYIHDALKEAQKQRDSVYRPYGPIIEEPGQRVKQRRMGPIAGASLLLLLIIALTVWLAGRDNLPAGAQHAGLATAETVVAPAGQGADRVPLAQNKAARALYERALLHHQQGELEEARILYGRILADDGSFSHAANNLGVIYLLREDRESARSYFFKAIAGNADYADPLYNLACLYAGKGEQDQALDYLEKALKINNTVKIWAEHDRDLASVRSLPRFRRIMEQGGPATAGSGRMQ